MDRRRGARNQGGGSGRGGPPRWLDEQLHEAPFEGTALSDVLRTPHDRAEHAVAFRQERSGVYCIARVAPERRPTSWHTLALLLSNLFAAVRATAKTAKSAATPKKRRAA